IRLFPDALGCVWERVDLRMLVSVFTATTGEGLGLLLTLGVLTDAKPSGGVSFSLGRAVALYM
ncbi:hypothetical protein CSUI_008599, partial [Cystoisospora suis]